MVYKIAVIPGDGVGPEIINAAVRVLHELTEVADISFEFENYMIGYSAWKELGTALPQETVDGIRRCTVSLCGPHGMAWGHKDVPIAEQQSPKGMLRPILDLYLRITPIKSYQGVKSCLRQETDLVFVVEGIEGHHADRNLATGYGEYMPTKDVAVGLKVITRAGSERLARYAFELAKSRKKRLTLQHKLGTSKYTEGIRVNAFEKVKREYPDIQFDKIAQDALAMLLITAPQRFDVIAASDMIGILLTWEAAATVGGIGMVPVGCVGDKYAMFEPIHGAGWDLAGKDIANPIATILASKMMLEWLAKRNGGEAVLEAARKIEAAVETVLKEGKVLTPDIGGAHRTSEVADEIAAKLRSV